MTKTFSTLFPAHDIFTALLAPWAANLSTRQTGVRHLARRI